jgi:hypothetical protein
MWLIWLFQALFEALLSEWLVRLLRVRTSESLASAFGALSLRNLGNDPVDRPSLRDRRDDPVYKKNLQGLIERNRQFEEARKARNESHS